MVTYGNSFNICGRENVLTAMWKWPTVEINCNHKKSFDDILHILKISYTVLRKWYPLHYLMCTLLVWCSANVWWCVKSRMMILPVQFVIINLLYSICIPATTDARSMGSSRTGGMTTDSDMYDTGEDEILEACVRTATKPSSRPPRERKRSRSQRKSCKWNDALVFKCCSIVSPVVM